MNANFAPGFRGAPPAGAMSAGYAYAPMGLTSGGRVVAGGAGGGYAVAGVARRGDAFAAAENCVAACVCAGEPPEAELMYVGYGEGDYVTEMNYKCVGWGNGNLALVAPLRGIWGRFACAIFAVSLIIIIVVLLWDYPVTTTTTRRIFTTTVPPHHGECTFWGDPHLKTFDGAHPNFYGEGESWVVRTSQISIQARYMGTKYTKGLAATNAIAVGGSFLLGHVIEVGTLESGVLVADDTPILHGFGTYHFAGLATLTYDGTGELVDAAAGAWAKKVVHMRLPLGVRVTVFRWSNYIDVRITMPPFPDIDGACGNFNSDPSDDTTAAIQARVGARVGPGDLLFHHRAALHFTVEEQQLVAACQPATYARAYRSCRSQLAGPHLANQQKACILNLCYGANSHTLRYAKKLGF
uniref:VWFD domain-containing protein n=1 Tax=Zooxanthella nutricula TaxID=1333877 RepID=A0A6V0BVB1_9DINO|mmetsp:Transcript_15270/g.45280  ORF Transcript_15270/g.45280 Transcript_15270/m.45280 type:complete len:410 (+) Transcript_15270:34-1263(+)